MEEKRARIALRRWHVRCCYLGVINQMKCETYGKAREISAVCCRGGRAWISKRFFSRRIGRISKVSTASSSLNGHVSVFLQILH